MTEEEGEENYVSLTAHLVVLHCEFYYIPDSKFLTLYGFYTQRQLLSIHGQRIAAIFEIRMYIIN